MELMIARWRKSTGVSQKFLGAVISQLSRESAALWEELFKRARAGDVEALAYFRKHGFLLCPGCGGAGRSLPRCSQGWLVLMPEEQ